MDDSTDRVLNKSPGKTTQPQKQNKLKKKHTKTTNIYMQNKQFHKSMFPCSAKVPMVDMLVCIYVNHAECICACECFICETAT